jgi:hypothetical protein
LLLDAIGGNGQSIFIGRERWRKDGPSFLFGRIIGWVNRTDQRFGLQTTVDPLQRPDILRDDGHGRDDDERHDAYGNNDFDETESTGPSIQRE